MKRQLIDSHKDYFFENIHFFKLTFTSIEYKIALLYYQNKKTELEIARILELPIKKVENTMVTVCAKMIVHRSFPRPKKQERRCSKTVFAENQKFFVNHHQRFKDILRRRNYSICEEYFEKGSTLSQIGKEYKISTERVRQIHAHSISKISKALNKNKE